MDKQKIENDMRKCQLLFPELFNLLNRLMQSNRKQISELKTTVSLKEVRISLLIKENKRGL